MRLTKKNIIRYLNSKKIISPETKPLIKELPGGWLNPLFMVQTRKQGIVVKQVLSKGKESGRYKEFYFPKERMLNEYYALKTSNTYMPEYVPRIIKGDFKNNVMIMEYVDKSFLFYDLVKKKKISFKTIKAISDFIVRLHNSTLRNKDIKRKVSHKNYWHLKYKYQYLEVKGSKKIKEKIKDFVEVFSKRKYCLVHGDFHTRNILVTKNKSIKVVDFEECGYKDPAHDIGVMLSDLIIFNHLNNHVTKRHIKYFFDTYLKKIKFRNKEALKRSIIIHTAAIILSKLFGITRHRFVPAKIKQRLKGLADTAILKEIQDIRHFL